MRRAGAKNRPFFRIVVTEARSAREGRFVELLGHYDPRTRPEKVEIDRARLAHWMSAGAKPSDTVRTLIDRLPAPAADAPAAS
jgi:small subunit ribosomal protein S16